MISDSLAQTSLANGLLIYFFDIYRSHQVRLKLKYKVHYGKESVWWFRRRSYRRKQRQPVSNSHVVVEVRPRCHRHDMLFAFCFFVRLLLSFLQIVVQLVDVVCPNCSSALISCTISWRSRGGSTDTKLYLTSSSCKPTCLNAGAAIQPWLHCLSQSDPKWHGLSTMMVSY